LALRTYGTLATVVVLLGVGLKTPIHAWAEERLVIPGLTGQPGGRLTYAERTEPKTLNPVVALDTASRDVIHRLNADLVHINRATLATQPELAKSWKISTDGLHYSLTAWCSTCRG
jgi:ABC-type transport system substrate-binding protein